MWAAALSATVVSGCIAMSVRRLAAATCPTALDLAQLCDALEGARGHEVASRLRESFAGDPRGTSDLAWERATFDILEERQPAVREALWVEQRMEFMARVERWSRAPRVCARVSTSAGFLFASVGMLESLARPDWLAAGGAASLLFGALDALCVGFVGTSFCVAVSARSRIAVRAAAAAAERLIDRLEAIAASSTRVG